MKKRIGTIVMMMVVAVGVYAQQAGTGKLSVWLQEQMAIRERAGVVMKKKGDKVLRSHRAEDEEPMLITTFIKMSEDADNEVLVAHGCKLYAHVGDIRIVTIPMDSLPKVMALPEVKRIEANPSAHCTLDSVVKAVNVLPVYQETAEHQAFTGRGVVVGLMDVGFDLTHPTFYGGPTDEGYRIKTFWDQLAKNSDNERFPVGERYTTPEALLAKGCATDGLTQDHGTHTAGIAAGSGYDTPYRGLAYESDIVLVANAVTSDTIYIETKDYNKYTTATDALGFKYLFDYAEEQGKPCVVSFSEGYTPYLDGDDALYNEFLELLIGPGRILVVSAGNEGRSLTHFTKYRDISQAGSFIYSSKETALYRVLTDGTPVLHLMGYDPQQQTPTAQLTLDMNTDQWEGDMLVDTLFIANDTCAVSISRYDALMAGDKTIYQVRLTANKRVRELAPIALVVEGQDCDVTVYGNSNNPLRNLDIDSRWNAAQKGRNILAPGCMTAPICVGATACRMDYVNMDGQTFHYGDDIQRGELALFSSTGPALNGVMKPEVSAPGVYVVSSLSSYHAIGNSIHMATSEVNGRSYPWGINSGTSMSTPVVAGAIALWLQAKPSLTRADIIGILERTCQHPEAALSYPNERYGYGQIDVYRGLLDILGATAIKDIIQHRPQHVSISMHGGQLHLKYDTTPEKPVEVRIYSTGGTLVYHEVLTITQQHTVLSLPMMSKGIYIVQIEGEGSEVVRK